MKQPPKDGTMIIAKFSDYPFPLATVWNGANEEWMSAVPQVEPYDGEWNDYYFESESSPEENLVEWWPVPGRK